MEHPDVIVGVLPYFFKRNIGACARLDEELEREHYRHPLIPLYGNKIVFLKNTIPLEEFNNEDELILSINHNKFSRVVLFIPNTTKKGRASEFFKTFIKKLEKELCVVEKIYYIV
jgi:hypothetical protein